jgi:hypothetical protein
MSLKFFNDSITSNQTAHAARVLPGQEGLWEVTWLPGHSMDYKTAVTAMGLADMSKYDEPAGGFLTPEIIEAGG